VFLPQLGSIVQAISAPYEKDRMAALTSRWRSTTRPPCLTGFLPAPDWRSPSDTRHRAIGDGNYCRIPQTPSQRGSRCAATCRCMDVPGKTRPRRPGVPQQPALRCRGHQPVVRDPNQILNCPAPGDAATRAVKPGFVIPAPSGNNGLNRCRRPVTTGWAGTPPPTSDPLQRRAQDRSNATVNNPTPCIYTPGGPRRPS